MLRHLTKLSTTPTSAVWRRRGTQLNVQRGLRCQAAVNAHDDAKTAVDDCLERVLGPGSKPASSFAVVFFEGHDQAGVQDALNSFAERRPQAPPVIGCGLGESAYEQQKRRLKQQQSARRLALASGSSTGKPGHKLTPSSAPVEENGDGGEGELFSREPSGSLRSPKIVTVLGLGFQGDEELEGEEGDGGGRGRSVEALPVYADGGSFPNVQGKDSIIRIFELPKEKQPLFFMLSKEDQSVPASDLQETNRRLGKLLPNSSALCAMSSGDPSSVVSSFPVGDGAPVVGVCLLGEVSLEEKATLARKTLGAFGFSAITVTGDVCDELFVPAQQPAASGQLLLDAASPSSLKVDTLEQVQEQLRLLAQQDGQEERLLRWQQQKLEQRQQQLGVFKVDEVLFPGMTRRFRIFEPRYRALVKQCLADDEPLVILPLSRGGNTVATAARVSGLHNVEEDGRCEVEITGVARCNVKTMWMKGESFGLFEAVVELFGDVDDVKKEKVQVTRSIRSNLAENRNGGAAAVVDEAETAASDPEGTGSTEGPEKRNGEELVAELPELERLRIEVSAVLQKELHRTRTQGRSPLWPGWDGSVSENDANAAAFTAAPAPLPPSDATTTPADGPDNNNNGGGGAGDGSSSSSENDASSNGGGEGGSAGPAVAEGTGTRIGDKSSIGGLDPCDLDAEALSYWAAQNVEAGALMKHQWLSTTSTAERLRGVRDLCRFALARHRDRSGVDGGVLSRPLSALRDLTSR
ncbi:unnamed protein product [Scytosiphon promiscuus]